MLQGVAKNKDKKRSDREGGAHFQFLLSFIHSFYPEYSMIPYCMSVTFIGDIGIVMHMTRKNNSPYGMYILLELTENVI